MQKEFKVGDKVKVILQGAYHLNYTEGFSGNGWTRPMDDYFGKEYLVSEVNEEDGVLLEAEETYWFPPAALELVEEKKEEKHQYKEGDKVIFLHFEENGNKVYDENRFTLGKVYVVYDTCGDKHICVIDDNGCTAYARKDQVKLVQEEEVQEIQEAKYTVFEFITALNSETRNDYFPLREGIEMHLQQARDPEWQEFQRLKKKFED